MKEEKRTVALIFGGVGCEREVSIKAAPYVLGLIDENKYRIIPLLIEKNGEIFCVSFSSDGTFKKDSAPAHLYRMYGRGGVLINGDFYTVDAAFPLLHGDGGEDGTVQGLLSALSIPYVGCDGYSGPIAMDKVYTKIIAESLGIPVAKYLTGSLSRMPKKNESNQRDAGLKANSKAQDTKERFISLAEELAAQAESVLDYPMIVKPSRLGSSFGISKANNRSELLESVIFAANSGDGRVLIEETVKIALEAELALFSIKNKTVFSEPGGIICSGIYDHNLKYESPDSVTVTERLPLGERVAKTLRDYSERLADFLGLRHLSRIDFFITDDNRILFNEINTMPGFTGASLYPRLINEAGICPKYAVNAFIEDAIEG